MIELDEKTFVKTVKEDTLTLVDFWAPWCGPCKILSPILEELADEMDGRAVFGKVNVDDYGELAQQFGIESIPTVILFKKGKALAQMIGFRSREELAEEIEKHL